LRKGNEGAGKEGSGDVEGAKAKRQKEEAWKPRPKMGSNYTTTGRTGAD